jgi:hypothetical protein
VTTYLQQRLNHAPQLYSDVPLEITFMDSDWNRHTEVIFAEGECGYFETILPFEPVLTAIDMDEKISDAITDEVAIISQPGEYNFEMALFEMEVLNITDSAFIRVEHNWVAPSQMKTPVSGLHLSDYRYWKIDGILPATFDATGRILYNGTNSLNGGFLDNSFITNSEDSLVLMYRESPKEDWTIYTDYELNTFGPTTDKRGRMDISVLRLGEYAMAIYDASRPNLPQQLPGDCLNLNTSIDDLNNAKPDFDVFPNPADNTLNIEISNSNGQNSIAVISMAGKVVLDKKIPNGNSKVLLPVADLPNGFYLVKWQKNGKVMAVKKEAIFH